MDGYRAALGEPRSTGFVVLAVHPEAALTIGGSSTNRTDNVAYPVSLSQSAGLLLARYSARVKFVRTFPAVSPVEQFDRVQYLHRRT